MSSKPRYSAKCLQTATISAGRWDRRRGCRAAVSPACCRYRVSVREFPGQRRMAGTTRHRISPVCRRAALPVGPWSCRQARRCLAAVPVASARSRLRARAPAVPFGPVASPAQAGLVRSPSRTRPSACMRERASVSLSCSENGSHARRFRIKSETSGFTITDQREMSHRRHRSAFGQADTAVFCRPIGQPCPWKFRPPPEPPR